MGIYFKFSEIPQIPRLRDYYVINITKLKYISNQNKTKNNTK